MLMPAEDTLLLAFSIFSSDLSVLWCWGFGIRGSLDHRNVQGGRGGFHVAPPFLHWGGQPLSDHLHFVIWGVLHPWQLRGRGRSGSLSLLQDHTWTNSHHVSHMFTEGIQKEKEKSPHLHTCTQTCRGLGRRDNAHPSRGHQSGRPGGELWFLSGPAGSDSELGHSHTMDHIHTHWKHKLMTLRGQNYVSLFSNKRDDDFWR